MKKVISLLICLLTLSGLFLSSCKAVQTTTSTNTSTTTGIPTQTITKTASPTTEAVSKPQYGGTISSILISDILGFDLTSSPNSGATQPYTNLCLVGGDWAKGPAGTNEVSWTTNSGWYGLDYERGNIAESWEIPELGTVIFHIRHGIHYAVNPNSEASKLMNGRELNADDVIFSFNRAITYPISFTHITQPALCASASFEELDKWTVIMKTPVDPWTAFLLFAAGIGDRIMAPEVIQKYGNQLDWQNSAGQGPFILTDFVSNSQATLVRNDNYWDKDPVGPGKGNQLPYAASLKMLIITDTSSQLAAIRTGKADVYRDVNWDDAKSLMDSSPQLKYVEYLGDLPYVIGMRTDKTDSFFKDVKVRQALMMALDYDALKDFFGGKSELINWPVTYQPGNQDLIDPLDKQPQAVQVLYSHDVQGAKKLLAEAGYADGFHTTVITSNIGYAVDLLSAIKDQWSKINVNLELQIKEVVAYQSIANNRSYNDMLYSMALGTATYANMVNFRGSSMFNRSYWDDPTGTDPTIEKAYTEIQQNLLKNDKKTRETFHDLMPYLLEQVPVIAPPMPYTYAFWQPWLKNYHGEGMMDYSMYDAYTWVWVDQDMKKAMK